MTHWNAAEPSRISQTFAALGSSANFTASFNPTYAFDAFNSNTSMTDGLTAYARGFTAHDVDAAEALSSLAQHQQQQQQSPARQRAHTVSHTGDLQHTPTTAPSSAANYRLSAPAALPALYQTDSFYAYDSAFTFALGYAAQSPQGAPLLSMNSSRTAAPVEERKSTRGAALEVTAAPITPQRRLVESPSGKPCPNCHASTSTLWRSCALLSGHHYLCNACGLRFKKGKYCPLCTRVYYDADTHAGHFKQCATCANWTHKSCLVKAGELADENDGETNPFERAKPYQCQRCRKDDGRMQL